jgi:predicted deacylase
LARRRRVALAVALAALGGGGARAERHDPLHDDASLNHRLGELHAQHPETTRLYSVHTTAAGREVLALEFDAEGRFAPDAPVLLVYGGVHGSEWISTEVVLRLAELVVEGDGAPEGIEIHLVPAVNVDGFATGERTAVGEDGGPYDANRAFTVPYQPERRGPPLVEAFKAYTRRGRLVGALDYHSPARAVMWPWAFARRREPAGVDALKPVARAMAEAAGFGAGQVALVIRYRHHGTAQDWIQHFRGAPTLLVELEEGDKLDAAGLERSIAAEERPFRLFVDWVRERLRRHPAKSNSPKSGARVRHQ